MKAVFLDTRSMGDNMDFSSLETAVDSLTYHDQTNPGDVAARLAEADIAIVNKVVLNADILSQCPRLKLIAVTATGTNNIDLTAARERGIRVCNATRYGRSALVQHNFSLLLALAGNLLPYLRDVRDGKWQQASQFCLMDHPIMELEGKTLGIIGYGDLGQGMARMAEAFGMEVLIARRGNQPVEGRVLLSDMLPRVDVLSIHCLLSEETRNLITLDELRQMKPGAFLLNTARGGIVNEADLVTALREGMIAGAGVDVLSEDPPRQGNPLLAADLPNLLVTPHCAWASREARQRILEITANSIACFRQGKPQDFVV